MPTPPELHDYLTIAQQIAPSVPGALPSDKVTDPNLTYWVGLIGFVTTVAATLAYLLGIKAPGAKSDPLPAAAANAAIAQAEAHDPSASMYWDAILTSIFEGIKRVEAHALAIAANDASLRTDVLRAAQEARHGVSTHMQQHIAVQQRHHDENARAIEEISREIATSSAQVGNQIAGLSGQINALAVTLGKIETLVDRPRR